MKFYGVTWSCTELLSGHYITAFTMLKKFVSEKPESSREGGGQIAPRHQSLRDFITTIASRPGGPRKASRQYFSIVDL